MVNRTGLPDGQWEIFYALLLQNGRVHVGPLEKCRRFLNAVLWILRSGAQWRLLPVSLGK
ncbi:MAG: transposase, partial [Methylosarcina sp.]